MRVQRRVRQHHRRLRAYVLKAEHEYRPGSEAGKHLSHLWPGGEL